MKLKWLKIPLGLMMLMVTQTLISQYQVPDVLQNVDSDEPTVAAVDLLGGYQQVADKTARNAIPEEKRVVGMAVTYFTTEWITQIYEGADVSESNWTNDANWLNLAMVSGNDTEIFFNDGGAVGTDSDFRWELDTLWIHDLHYLANAGSALEIGNSLDVASNLDVGFNLDVTNNISLGNDLTIANGGFIIYESIGEGYQSYNSTSKKLTINVNGNSRYLLGDAMFEMVGVSLDMDDNQYISFGSSRNRIEGSDALERMKFVVDNDSMLIIHTDSITFAKRIRSLGQANFNTDVVVGNTIKTGDDIFCGDNFIMSNLTNEIQWTGTAHEIGVTSTYMRNTVGAVDVMYMYADSIDLNEKLNKKHYYGQIYTDAGFTVAIGATDTYYTCDGFTTDGSSNTTLTDSTVTIATDGYGLYHVGYHSSFTHSSSTSGAHMSGFINDVEDTRIEGERKIGTGGDFGSMSAGAYVFLNGGDIVKIKVKSDATGTVTINHMNFFVTRL